MCHSLGYERAITWGRDEGRACPLKILNFKRLPRASAVTFDSHDAEINSKNDNLLIEVRHVSSQSIPGMFDRNLSFGKILIMCNDRKLS